VLSRWSAPILGVGSLAFAVWALAAPRPFAAFMGVPPRWGRWLGARDLLIGSAILLRPGTPTFAMRALADASDAATAGKPRVAAGAAGFCLWAVTAALASRYSSTR
jgi:hypothetical protein